MIIPDKELDDLRALYGEVLHDTYSDPKGEKHSIVLRAPKFDEYLFFNRNSTAIQAGEQVKYELDPEVVQTFFTQLLIYPKDINISTIPVGVLIKNANDVVSIYALENESNVKSMYIDSIKNANSMLGAIVTTLVSTYGIQIYPMFKSLNESEIMDLIVIGEAMTDTIGKFAEIANIPGLPWTVRGKVRKLNVEQLLGLRPTNNNVTKTGQQQKSDEWLRNYYKSLRYKDEDIEKMINKLNHIESEISADRSPITEDGKIDMNNMSDEDLQKMSNREYNQLKKDGKILSHEESQQLAVQDNKAALAQKIAEDKARFNTDKKGESFDDLHYKGNLDNLLQQVKDKTRDME
jgi:hypothetical protein